jgi:hypothetical protein
MKVINFWDSKIQGFLQHTEIPGFYSMIQESQNIILRIIGF